MTPLLSISQTTDSLSSSLPNRTLVEVYKGLRQEENLRSYAIEKDKIIFGLESENKSLINQIDTLQWINKNNNLIFEEDRKYIATLEKKIKINKWLSIGVGSLLLAGIILK